VIDEIGKMELFSRRFEQAVRQLMSRSDLTLLATIPVKRRVPVEFADEVRTSPTVRLFEVSENVHVHVAPSLASSDT